MASSRSGFAEDSDLEEVPDSRDKKPSATMKRNVDKELSKKELLDILVAMESELQAREVAFAALKADKTDGSLQKFRYGCFSALQHDSILVTDDGGDWEAGMKSMYARQLALLDNLIQTQHKTQHKTRTQLAAVERQYHKVCAELDLERRERKAESAVETDSMHRLEEDKSQLRKELEEERRRSAKLEEDLLLLGELLSGAKAEANRHRLGAIVLAKERRWFAEKIAKMVAIIERLEESLAEEREKVEKMTTQFEEAEAQMKSESKRHAQELCTARELHQKSLDEKERKIHELYAEIERLRSQLHSLQMSCPSEQSWNSSTPLGSELVAASCSVTLPFPLNPAADSIDVKDDTVSVTFVLPTDPSSSIVSCVSSESSKSNLPPSNKVPSSVQLLTPSDNSSIVMISDKSPTIRLVSPSKSTVAPSGLPRLAVGGHSRIPQFHGTMRLPSSPSKTTPVRMDLRNPEIPSTDWHTASVSEPVQADESGASNLDIFGPEMANLQQLLVSMATGEPSAAAVAAAKAELVNQAAEPGVSQSSPVCQSKEGSASSGTVPDTVLSSIHAAILAMDHVSLARLVTNYRPDLNEPISNGILPLHMATESGSEECVRVLLEHGADPSAIRDDHSTPLHVAATEGHLRCLLLLLEYGGCVSSTDQSGWTPLHCAASNGHSDCCRVLLDQGARIDAVTNANWTPLHSCIHSGHSACLETILGHQRSNPSHYGDQILDTLIEDVVNMVDKDGWTIAHLATVRESKDCLEVLSRHIHLDLERRDKWNRSVLDVASVTCRQFLQEIGSRQEVACIVSIELASSTSLEAKASAKRPASSGLDQSLVNVGSVVVSKVTTWVELEEKLGCVFLNHTSEVSIGLRTKKTSRLDQDSPDAPNPFTLGISLSSVKYYTIGRYHWSPGTSTEKTPFEMLASFNTNVISVRLFGLDDGCQESLAYEMLIPVSVLQNYLRLIEQYRSVVFYGPKGTGKTFLVRKLARCIQVHESRQGNASEVTFFTLSAVFSRKDLLKLLLDKGCLINASSTVSPTTATPILILDDLAKISVVDVFKDILPAMETRGPANPILIRHDGSQETLSCYMNPNCYIIATMDRARSTGLELSIQQRFKWVHLRCDQEPIKYLLHRYLLRRLAHSYRGCIPLPDNSIYKAVEWVICVWQRLNEGLAKLGLLDLVFGPCYFLVCPIEANKPKTILRWLNIQWNQVIAPTITEAVIRGSGSDLGGGGGGGGHQKVASTALYVLMQRAVVSGCPLSGLEKERYFAGFQGSNELDIKIRNEKREQKSLTGMPPVPADGTLQRSTRNTIQESFMVERTESNTMRNVAALAEDESRTMLRKADPNGSNRSTTKDNIGSFSSSSLFAVSGIPAKPPTTQPPLTNTAASPLTRTVPISERRSPLAAPKWSDASTASYPDCVTSSSSSISSEMTFSTVPALPQRTPVIITQPIRGSTPTANRTLGDVASLSRRSVERTAPMSEGAAVGVASPPELDRVLAEYQWRRAISPGPDIFHIRDARAEENAHRSGSPGPDLLQSPRSWRNDAVPSGALFQHHPQRNAVRFQTTQHSAMTLGPEGGISRRIDFRVVNPTKVLPIDVASMTMRDSPK